MKGDLGLLRDTFNTTTITYNNNKNNIDNDNENNIDSDFERTARKTAEEDRTQMDHRAEAAIRWAAVFSAGTAPLEE